MRGRRIACGLLVVAAVAVLDRPPSLFAGKPNLEFDFAGTRGFWWSGSTRMWNPKTPTDPRERLYVIQAKDARLAYGYRPFARALWAPFRWETSVGVPFPEQTAGIDPVTSSFGTQLVTEEASTYGVQVDVQRDTTGLTVTALRSADFLGTMQFPNAVAVDLAIEHDGSKLHVFAREAGGATFAELGTGVADTQTTPLFPVVSAFGVVRPAAVAFDDFRVVASAELPGTGDTHDAIERIYDGVDQELDALHRLDGPQTQTAQLSAQILASAESYTTAKGLVRGGARKKLSGAIAKSKAAAKALDAGKPTEIAVKALRKAIDLAFAARKAVASSQ